VSGEYTVSAARLQEVATGINNTIGELKTLGIAEAAEQGRGFDNLELTGLQVGHQGLQEAFDQFCQKWEWGVRSLVSDGNQLAVRLNLSAGGYHDADQYVAGVFKDLLNAFVGNPHATEQQVENSSVGQILSSTITPDYSAQSFQQAGQTAASTWNGVGRDLAEGPMGMTRTEAQLVGLDGQLTAAENQMFGPEQLPTNH
jgi:hypothetical protein